MKHMAPAPSRKIYGAERGSRWVIVTMAVLILAQVVGGMVAAHVPGAAVHVPAECWVILTGGLVALWPSQVVGQGVADARAARAGAPRAEDDG